MFSLPSHSRSSLSPSSSLYESFYDSIRWGADYEADADVDVDVDVDDDDNTIISHFQQKLKMK